MPARGTPTHVEAMAARLKELWPDARIEIEPRWYVRAYGKHDLCVDVRNLTADGD